MAKKQRLDKALVERGLVASRERARALILAGNVDVAGQRIDKAGYGVHTDDDIHLRVPDHEYVSRGAFKLIAGLDAFAITPAGYVALDIGASTGGFTDVLLRRGAKRVYAVDVGYGQLAWKLRQDPRVRVLERENIRYLDPTKIPEPCDLAVIDVSFISLTLVLPAVAALLGPPMGKPIIALVKPQFEVGREAVGKGGVVRDAAARDAAVASVCRWAKAHGFQASSPVPSPLPGPAGNIEYLVRFCVDGNA